jgi:DNA-binding PadR family transcriptional regulator
MPPRISTLPRNQERHALQVLLSGIWKPAFTLLPTGDRILTKMVEKGWIQRRVTKHFEYRITDAGREAFHAPLPIKAKGK